MSDEVIDLLNENGSFTGKTVLKSFAHKNNLWHKSIHVWIFNKDKGILLQKRAKTKKLFPNLWDVSVAGHVQSGEDVNSVALREAKEELGINLNKKILKKIFQQKQSSNCGGGVFENIFCDVFTYQLSHVPLFVLQKEEVDSVKFVPINILEKDLFDEKKRVEFIPGVEEYWLKVIDEIKKEI